MREGGDGLGWGRVGSCGGHAGSGVRLDRVVWGRVGSGGCEGSGGRVGPGVGWAGSCGVMWSLGVVWGLGWGGPGSCGVLAWGSLGRPTFHVPHQGPWLWP